MLSDKFLRAKVEVLQDPACIRLMRDFIKGRPELWNEDIGSCEFFGLDFIVALINSKI
jgi:hypothetical protein